MQYQKTAARQKRDVSKYA